MRAASARESRRDATVDVEQIARFVAIARLDAQHIFTAMDQSFAKQKSRGQFAVVSGGVLCIVGVWYCVRKLPLFWLYDSANPPAAQ